MKIIQNEITGTQTGFSTNFGGKLSFIMPFLFPECLHCCYICFPTCIITIISLEPYALNVQFQHFILRFNKISLLCRYPWKRVWRQGDFLDNSIIWCLEFKWDTLELVSYSSSVSMLCIGFRVIDHLTSEGVLNTVHTLPGLDYTQYPMASSQLQDIINREVKSTWPIIECYWWSPVKLNIKKAPQKGREIETRGKYQSPGKQTAQKRQATSR
jgi:hypothetical protein